MHSKRVYLRHVYRHWSSYSATMRGHREGDCSVPIHHVTHVHMCAADTGIAESSSKAHGTSPGSCCPTRQSKPYEVLIHQRPHFWLHHRSPASLPRPPPSPLRAREYFGLLAHTRFSTTISYNIFENTCLWGGAPPCRLLSTLPLHQLACTQSGIGAQARNAIKLRSASCAHA